MPTRIKQRANTDLPRFVFPRPDTPEEGLLLDAGKTSFDERELHGLLMGNPPITGGVYWHAQVRCFNFRPKTTTAPVFSILRCDPSEDYWIVRRGLVCTVEDAFGLKFDHMDHAKHFYQHLTTSPTCTTERLPGDNKRSLARTNTQHPRSPPTITALHRQQVDGSRVAQVSNDRAHLESQADTGGHKRGHVEEEVAERKSLWVASDTYVPPVPW